MKSKLFCVNGILRVEVAGSTLDRSGTKMSVCADMLKGTTTFASDSFNNTSPYSCYGQAALFLQNSAVASFEDPDGSMINVHFLGVW